MSPVFIIYLLRYYYLSAFVYKGLTDEHFAANRKSSNTCLSASSITNWNCSISVWAKISTLVEDSKYRCERESRPASRLRSLPGSRNRRQLLQQRTHWQPKELLALLQEQRLHSWMRRESKPNPEPHLSTKQNLPRSFRKKTVSGAQ